MKSSIVRLLPALLLTGTFATGCNRMLSIVTTTYTGDGNVTTDNRSVSNFTALKLEGAYDVVLTQSAETSLRIECDKNLLSHITTTVSGNTLTISSDGNLQPTKSVKVYISTPNYSSVQLDGAGAITATTPITSDDLALGIAGSGDYTLEVHAKKLHTSISGSGDIMLKGGAGSYSAKITGSGDLKASQLAVDTLSITVAGAGDAALNVAKKLIASVEGSGDVTYIGAVTDIQSNIDGSGSVTRGKD